MKPVLEYISQSKLVTAVYPKPCEVWLRSVIDVIGPFAGRETDAQPCVIVPVTLYYAMHIIAFM